MASSMTPKSLQRTDSTGQLNVYLLLKKKSNDDLLIVSRENLPPTLRSGKLVLYQKIVFRDEQRTNVEAVIIYMHSARDNCVAFKTQMLGNNTENTNELNNTTFSVNSNSSSSSSHAGINAKFSKNISKKSNMPPPATTKKPSKPTSSNKPRIEPRADLSFEIEDQGENDVLNFDISNNIHDDISFSSTTNSNEQNKTKTVFNGTNDTLIRTTDDDENNVFLDKINELSMEIKQQKTMIKDRDTQIKRLQTTTIELPRDQATRDFFCYMADKIRATTTKHQYIGNLTNDARTLGIDVIKLNEILQKPTGITSVAREIFKRIVPIDKRAGKRWNELSEYVHTKEIVLIKFLQDYYGYLEADEKKIHNNIVGCLRNDRGREKQVQQQDEILHNNNGTASDAEDIDDVHYGNH